MVTDALLWFSSQFIFSGGAGCPASNTSCAMQLSSSSSPYGHSDFLVFMTVFFHQGHSDFLVFMAVFSHQGHSGSRSYLLK